MDGLFEKTDDVHRPTANFNLKPLSTELEEEKDGNQEDSEDESKVWGDNSSMNNITRDEGPIRLGTFHGTENNVSYEN